VDSAVAALLLKRAGFDVVGLIARNWDESEESGAACGYERDLRDGTDFIVPVQVATLAQKPLSKSFEEIAAKKILRVEPQAEVADEAADTTA
jgi:tRNA-specific 2-thiouridylase